MLITHPRSACNKPPAPDTPLPKFKVNGPLPPFAASEVQITVSPAANPVPVQLHGVAAQTTVARPLGAAKLAVTVKPAAELAVKLAARIVPSGPNCDQCKESFAP